VQWCLFQGQIQGLGGEFMEGQKPPTGVQERSPLGAFGDEVHQKLVIYCKLYYTVKIQRAVFMQ